jgi:hypothetical protein
VVVCWCGARSEKLSVSLQAISLETCYLSSVTIALQGGINQQALGMEGLRVSMNVFSRKVWFSIRLICGSDLGHKSTD